VTKLERPSAAAEPQGELAEKDEDQPADQDKGKSAGEGFPGIDFVTFVLSLSHSAYLHLGDAPNPSNGKLERNLTMAQQTIDLLGLLEQKTQGNLTGEEERVLEQVLYELRSRYVEVLRSAG
jgi:hypothetical protein